MPGDVVDVSSAPLGQVTLSVQALDINPFVIIVKRKLWKAFDYNGDQNDLADVIV